MRSLALAFVVLGAVVPATALSAARVQNATQLYSACSCHFGYEQRMHDNRRLSQRGRSVQSFVRTP